MRPKKSWHASHQENLSSGGRIADNVVRAMGSWTFIMIMSALIVAWIAANLIGAWEHWDPYPFILLNLAFSAQATYAAPLIMMSQNRQSERDREQAQHDYETNLAAKAEIEELIATLSRIEVEKLDTLHILINALSAKLDASPAAAHP